MVWVVAVVVVVVYTVLKIRPSLGERSYALSPVYGCVCVYARARTRSRINVKRSGTVSARSSLKPSLQRTLCVCRRFNRFPAECFGVSKLHVVPSGYDCTL